MSDDVNVPGEMGVDPDVATSMHDLLEADFALKQIKRGDVLTGTILRVSPSEISGGHQHQVRRRNRG